MFDEILEIGDITFKRTETYMEQFYVYVKGRPGEYLERPGEPYPNIESAIAAYNRAKKAGREVSMKRVVTAFWDAEM